MHGGTICDISMSAHDVFSDSGRTTRRLLSMQRSEIMAIKFLQAERSVGGSVCSVIDVLWATTSISTGRVHLEKNWRRFVGRVSLNFWPARFAVERFCCR